MLERWMFEGLRNSAGDNLLSHIAGAFNAEQRLNKSPAAVYTHWSGMSCSVDMMLLFTAAPLLIMLQLLHIYFSEEIGCSFLKKIYYNCSYIMKKNADPDCKCVDTEFSFLFWNDLSLIHSMLCMYSLLCLFCCLYNVTLCHVVLCIHVLHHFTCSGLSQIPDHIPHLVIKVIVPLMTVF